MYEGGDSNFVSDRMELSMLGLGGAVIAEAGVLSPHGLRFGRIAVTAQLVVPRFRMHLDTSKYAGPPGPSPDIHGIELLLVGLRAFL